MLISEGTSFEDDKAKTCDEPLSVGDTVAADDFLARVELMRLQLHTNFSLVVIDVL